MNRRYLSSRFATSRSATSRFATSSRRGFFVIDVAIALFLIAALLAALGLMLAAQSRAAARLQESRAALRIAEQAMLDLQSRRQPSAPDDAQLEVRDLERSGGLRWVQVSVTFKASQAQLVGAVAGDAP